MNAPVDRAHPGLPPWEHARDLRELLEDLYFKTRACQVVGIIGLVVTRDGRVLHIEAGDVNSTATCDQLYSLASSACIEFSH